MEFWLPIVIFIFLKRFSTLPKLFYIQVCYTKTLNSMNTYMCCPSKKVFLITHICITHPQMSKVRNIILWKLLDLHDDLSLISLTDTNFLLNYTCRFVYIYFDSKESEQFFILSKPYRLLHNYIYY